MRILTIKTDQPEAEIGLYDDVKQVSYIKWQAHRQLAETIHAKIKELLDGEPLESIQGVVVFKGPGSFTGLRIGISVANALADSLSLPIVGSAGETWIAGGVESLLKGTNDKIVLPEYGAPVHITQQKK